MIKVYERWFNGHYHTNNEIDQSRITGKYKTFGKEYWIEVENKPNILTKFWKWITRGEIKCSWIHESNIVFEEVEYFNCKNP